MSEAVHELGDVVDPDVDVKVGVQRRELVRTHGVVLGVIAVGGGLGSLARYGIAELLPTRPGLFPGGTFLTNVSGCFLIGVLMVLITEVRPAHRLARPFLGVGFLGGFTTFSTYTNEIRGLLRPGTIGPAMAYLAGTLICALLAVIAATWLTRTLTGVTGRHSQ